MMQDLTQKQIQLLELLVRREGAVGAEELAAQLDISARTVLRYIPVLNEELKVFDMRILMKRGLGYELAGNKDSLLPIIVHKEYRQGDGEKRIQQMILEIIEQDEVTIEKLGETMFLSPSTLNKLTAEVKEFLKDYGLSLVSKPYYGLTVSGDEMDVRTLLGDIGLDYCNARLVNTGIFNISEEELQVTDRVVFDYIQKYGLMVADMDLNNLSARIIISLSRSRKKRYVTVAMPSKPFAEHSYQMICSIMEDLGKRFGIEIASTECEYVMVYSGFIGFDLTEREAGDCEEMFDFIDGFLTEISTLTGIHYERSEKVMHVLSTHLKFLMQRAKSGKYSPNPIIGQIKNNYPLEMNYAILMAQRFEERFGVSINEDEIGYLTVYLGVYEPQTKERIEAVILCDYGIGTSQMILEKMQNELQEVLIRGVYPVRYLKLAMEREPDVIISAVQLEGYEGKMPLIVSRELLGEQAMREIRSRIWQRIHIEKELMSFFDPNCFIHLNAEDRFEAIDRLGLLLKERRGMDEDVIMDIVKRERISSTEVGNMVAVPHVLKQGDFVPCIAVGILDKPVRWGSEMVQMVFLACFNQSGEQSSRVFRTLYKVIRVDKLVRQLILAEDFIEFKNILCKGDY